MLYLVSLTDLRIFSVKHFVSVGKKVLGLGSHRIEFLVPRALPGMWHAPIDPIEAKFRAFRCKITENRSVGYTQTHCKQQVKYHPMVSVQAPGQRASRTRTQRLPASQHEPSAFLHLNAPVLRLLGQLEHARTQNPLPPTR